MTRGGLRTLPGLVLEALRSIEHQPFVLKGKLTKQQLTVKSLHVAKTAGLRALISAGQSRHWHLRRRSPHLCPALEEQRPEDLESHDLPVQLTPTAPGSVRDLSHRIRRRATDQCTVYAQIPLKATTPPTNT